MRLIEKVWFKQHRAKWLIVPLLLPFSLLFFLLSSCRRLAYRMGFFSSIKMDVPVIVVGNIGVGGNGKTPVTLYLVERLKAQGKKVGVVSRGYGSDAPYYPYQVNEQSTAEQAGDEPLLIFQRCNVPVVIGSDRIAGCHLLIEQGCEIIIADDGMQHYRLARTVELLVIDGKRLFGNGLLLPAGPLRELPTRMQKVDGIVINGESHFCELYANVQAPIFELMLTAKQLVHIRTGGSITVADFLAKHTAQPINAIAGIGAPERFFSTLSAYGFKLGKTQGFIDHQNFTSEDLSLFSAEVPLLMTEKDAVKCREFAGENYWYLPVDATFSNEQHVNEIDTILVQAFNKK